MKTYLVAVILPLSTLIACGSDSAPATASDTVPVSLTGLVQAMPIPKTESLPSFTNLRMRLFDANRIWSDAVGGDAPQASSLYDKMLVGINNACAADGCSFIDNGQNIASTGPNLVSLISGNVSSSQKLWAPVYTNIVGSQSLLNAQQHRGVLAANAPAYVISRYALGQLATQLGVADANTLLQRGLLIGFVRGKDPTNFSGGLPEGVSGAKISLTQAQAALVSVFYPNADYSNAKLASSTNADGAFYLLGNTAASAMPSTTLSIDAPNALYQWTNRPVALIAGSVVVAPLSALP